MFDFELLGKRAKEASRVLSCAKSDEKTKALFALADALEANCDYILSENENDDREDEFRDIDNESYLKHRVVRCITFHNRDYDDIKSIDYIKVGNRYRIYHSRVRKNCLEKELLLGNICESNLEYELVRMERKYGR